MGRAKSTEGSQVKACQECKTEKRIGEILPYYFSEYRKSFWLCNSPCKLLVFERYRERHCNNR